MKSSMEKEQVLENLCYYDERNPNHIELDEYDKELREKKLKKQGRCSCDNCFDGRTVLAEKIIELMSVLESNPK